MSKLSSLAAAPWWVHGVVAWITAAAGLFALGTLFSRFLRNPDYTWGHALVYGVLFGVVAGIVPGLSVAFRSRRRQRRSKVAAL